MTKRSRMLRNMASSTEFNAVSRSLIDKAERLERQADGLRYKNAKARLSRHAPCPLYELTAFEIEALAKSDSFYVKKEVVYERYGSREARLKP